MTTNNASEWEIYFSKQKEIDSTNSVRAELSQVGSTETHQKDKTFRKASHEVSIISAASDQQVVKQASEGAEFNTVNGEDQAILTPIGNVQYNVKISTKLLHRTRLHKATLQTLSTLAVQVKGTGRTMESIAQNTWRPVSNKWDTQRRQWTSDSRTRS